jgi:hypothetical protein
MAAEAKWKLVTTVCVQPDIQAAAQTPPKAVTGLQEKRPHEKPFSTLQRGRFERQSAPYRP